MPEFATELTAPSGYNLRRTMAGSRLGAHDPSIRLVDTAVAVALRTPNGAATIAALQRDDTIEIEGWGEGARSLVEHLPGLLGLDDDLASFAPERGVVRKLAREFSGMHLPRFPRVFDRLVRVTLLQVVTWQEACRAWGKLVREIGEAAPGPLDIRLPPSAEALKATPDYTLTALGIRPQQARTLLLAAKHVKKIETAASEGVEPLGELLTKIPGIGPWTIAYVQGSALGYPDAVLLGDYDLHHTVAYVLAGEERATEERMLELLEPYRGHRFRVIRLIWMNGVTPPRRGPRHPPLDMG